MENKKTIEKLEFEKEIFVGVKALTKKDEKIYISRIKKIFIKNSIVFIEGKKVMENKKNSRITLDDQIGILKKNIELMEDDSNNFEAENNLIEDYYKKLNILINIKREVE